MTMLNRLIAAGLLALAFFAGPQPAVAFDEAAFQQEAYLQNNNLIGFGARRASSASGFSVSAADFDGTSDYMYRGAFSGAVDGPTGIISFWMRLDGGDGALQRIIQTTTAAGTSVAIRRETTNSLQAFFRDTANTGSSILSTSTFTASSSWVHILIAWNTNFSDGNKIMQLYVNGVSDSPTPTDGHAAFSVASGASTTEWTIGSNSSAGGNLVNGCFAEFYINVNETLDLTNSANVAKFIVGGKPVSLGPTGALPTGTAPNVYLSVASGGAASAFATNLGTGGDYTIAGSLDLCTTSPSGFLLNRLPTYAANDNWTPMRRAG